MTNEEKWGVIVAELHSRLGEANHRALLEAVEHPGLPENRAAILNTCNVYPPEGVTREQVIELMINEWERRSGEEVKPRKAPKLPAKPKRRLILRRNCPNFVAEGARLRRQIITTEVKRNNVYLNNQVIPKEVFRDAVSAALNSIRGGFASPTNFIRDIISYLHQEITYQHRVTYNESQFTPVEGDVPNVQSTRRVNEPELLNDPILVARIREYITQYGGVEAFAALEGRRHVEEEEEEGE